MKVTSINIYRAFSIKIKLGRQITLSDNYFIFKKIDLFPTMFSTILFEFAHKACIPAVAGVLIVTNW